MADVRMSMEEYNEMRDELMMLRSIMNSLTTPRKDSWDIDHFKNQPEASMYLNSRNLSDDQEDYLRNLMSQNINDFIERNHLNDIENLAYFDDFSISMSIGRLYRKVEEDSND